MVDTTLDNVTTLYTQCTAAPGNCSLRGAVQRANANPGADVIEFSVPVADDPNCDAVTGGCRFGLSQGVLMVTDALTIDGYTQSGATPNTILASSGALNSVLKIELNNAGVANGAIIDTNEYGRVAIRGKTQHVEQIARVEVEASPGDPDQQVKKTTIRLKPTTTLTLLSHEGTVVEMTGDEALLSFITRNKKSSGPGFRLASGVVAAGVDAAGVDAAGVVAAGEAAGTGLSSGGRAGASRFWACCRSGRLMLLSVASRADWPSRLGGPSSQGSSANTAARSGATKADHRPVPACCAGTNGGICARPGASAAGLGNKLRRVPRTSPR